MAELTLDESQERAVELVCTAPIGIVTGGPGRGKTVSLRHALDRLDAEHKTYDLAAPTGKAAKRMHEATGRHATTIHRLLEFHPKHGFQRNAERPLDCSVVIIDESSMIDIELGAALLAAVDPAKTRVILIGDADQLPPVGPGRMFGDLVDSGEVPLVRLERLHRSAAESWVAGNAPKVLRGEMPDVRGRRDFKFLVVDEAKGIMPTLRHLVAEVFPTKIDAAVQVLIPQRPGVAGIDAANVALQAAINPRKDDAPYLARGKFEIRLGDRVIQTKNDYQLAVFNGEIGTVVAISGGEVVVEFEGREPVQYPLDRTGALQLAYALTVHRCVAPETLVETTRGLMTMAELGESGWIATAEGVRRFDTFVSNPPRPMLKIVTADGYELCVTPDHGMMAWDGETYRRYEAAALVEGQRLRLRLGETCSATLAPELPPAPRDLDVRAIHYATPPELTTEAAEFLGLMVADGTVYKGGFRLLKRHADVIDRFEQLCAQVLGAKVHRKTLGELHVGEVNSVQLSRWLLSIGGTEPNQKAVPRCVMRAPLAMQLAFLRGLFEDGTVNVKGGKLDHVAWSSCYETMARTVQIMLLRAGIVSSRVERDGQHAVYIYGRNAKRYGALIGFVSRFKAERLDLPTGNEIRYSVPVAHGRCCEHEDHNANNRRQVSRYRAQRLGGFEHELRFHHSKIRSITPYVGPSMCVRVPTLGRFLQNGFDGCNSQGSEWPWVIVVCHSTHSFILSRQLIYTAITRGKQGVVMVGDEKGMRRALKERTTDKRNTTLIERLRGELEDDWDNDNENDNDGRDAVEGRAS